MNDQLVCATLVYAQVHLFYGSEISERMPSASEGLPFVNEFYTSRLRDD